MCPSKRSGRRKDAATDSATSREAFVAITQLLDLMRGRANDVVQTLGLPLPAAMALTRLDEPIAMNKLGHELGCDPSFVTSLADILEGQGLVVRETDPSDRRVKKLKLTEKGRATRTMLEAAFADDLPGIRRLDPEERDAFVKLLRKMVSAERGESEVHGELVETDPDAEAVS
ncbi:MAG: MarR family transcriptional regulator [Actinobacteria bacterium]|nr:MarR family transcriptional regulator [Actinomycetota bacterium]